jgi:hypothetical protein
MNDHGLSLMNYGMATVAIQNEKYGVILKKPLPLIFYKLEKILFKFKGRKMQLLSIIAM